MPAVSRFMIKTAFAWLMAGLVLGIIIFLPVNIKYSTAFLPVFYHALTIGWLTQLVFGIAFWFLPKYSKEKPRGSEALAWVSYVSLNLGMILRAAGEPLVVISGKMYGRWMIFASMLFLSLAGLAFVFNSWKRTGK